jgi:hypothetical protein
MHCFAGPRPLIICEMGDLPLASKAAAAGSHRHRDTGIGFPGPSLGRATGSAYPSRIVGPERRTEFGIAEPALARCPTTRAWIDTELV